MDWKLYRFTVERARLARRAADSHHVHPTFGRVRACPTLGSAAGVIAAVAPCVGIGWLVTTVVGITDLVRAADRDALMPFGEGRADRRRRLGGATWVHCIAPIIKFLAGKAGSPGVPDDQPEGRRAEAGKDETQMRILRALVRWDIDELIEKA
jgi:hypothetical protein